ncbi:hypothetical protein ACUXCC_004579 [Cytobacillus horneckiae]
MRKTLLKLGLITLLTFIVSTSTFAAIETKSCGKFKKY